MMKPMLKPGDRVRLNQNFFEYPKGTEGVVSRVNPPSSKTGWCKTRVKFTGSTSDTFVFDFRLELIPPELTDEDLVREFRDASDQISKLAARRPEILELLRGRGYEITAVLPDEGYIKVKKTVTISL